LHGEHMEGDTYIIDAYNLMHADDELTALMDQDLEAARGAVIHEVSEFAAREATRVVLVFDAGGRPGAATTEKAGGNLEITYTAGGQSADAFIEKLAYAKPKSAGAAIVVTGDYAQQRIVGGAGLLRMSPREFLARLAESSEELRDTARKGGSSGRKVRVADRIPEDVRSALERLKREKS
jgi:predicted RNA-binding protein with PIN domain